MLRINASVITLTIGEVQAAEHRRRFRKHLERTTTFRISDMGHAQDEQNIGKEPALLTSASSSPVVKSDAGQFTTQDTNQRALESIPPQSPQSVDEYIAPVHTTTSPAQERAQQRYEARPTPHDTSSPMPRLLSMTPRRLGPTVRFAASSPSHVSEPASDELVGGADSSEPVVATVISPLEIGSPELPPPFSRATHVRSVEYTASPPTDNRDELLSTQYDPVTRSIRALRPTTPARRSSLSGGSNIRSLDGQADDGPDDDDGPTDDEGPVSARTRSGRNRHMHKYTSRHVSQIPTTPMASAGPARAVPTSGSPNSRLARLRVYDDSLPRWRQPETPSNLPESRHQSRLSGAYTAPARRNASQNLVTPVTSRRWRPNTRRSPSPVGLQNPGMLGLYGGLENTHDDVLYERVQRDLNELNWRDEFPQYDE